MGVQMLFAFDAGEAEARGGIAEGDRSGEVRFLGEVENKPAATSERMIRKLGKR